MLHAQEPAVLHIPQDWETVIQSLGWLHAGANNAYVFFERAGHWLRLTRAGEDWYATVMPELFRVPQAEGREPGCWVPFPDEQRAPAYRGRGAVAKARLAALALWEEHDEPLAELGIRLSRVGVRQFRGSGAGGYVDTKSYVRHELFPAQVVTSIAAE